MTNIYEPAAQVCYNLAAMFSDPSPRTAILLAARDIRALPNPPLAPEKVLPVFTAEDIKRYEEGYLARQTIKGQRYHHIAACVNDRLAVHERATQARINAAVLAEREACARICDDVDDHSLVAGQAIRSRPQPNIATEGPTADAPRSGSASLSGAESNADRKPTQNPPDRLACAALLTPNPRPVPNYGIPSFVPLNMDHVADGPHNALAWRLYKAAYKRFTDSGMTGRDWNDVASEAVRWAQELIEKGAGN